MKIMSNISVACAFIFILSSVNLTVKGQNIPASDTQRAVKIKQVKDDFSASKSERQTFTSSVSGFSNKPRRAVKKINTTYEAKKSGERFEARTKSGEVVTKRD